MGDLAERLKYLRNMSAKMSQAEFSAKIGITQTTWGRYERGENAPDVDTLIRLCEVLQIAPNWLLTGKGPIFANAQDQTPAAQQDGASSWQPPLLATNQSSDDPYKNSKWQEVPVFSLANCGPNEWYAINKLALRTPLPVDYPYHPENFAVIAMGVSMQPEGIRQGNVLFCDPSTNCDPGDIVYVEKTDNLASVKKFLKFDGHTLHLQGWEPPGPDGIQKPYFEELPADQIRRVVCVVIVKWK